MNPTWLNRGAGDHYLVIVAIGCGRQSEMDVVVVGQYQQLVYNLSTSSYDKFV